MDGFIEGFMSDMHTDTSICPSACVYISLVWKAGESLLVFPTVSPPPNTFLPSLRASLSRVVRTHSPCSRTQQLVKENTFPLSLTHILCSSLVFIHISKEKSRFLLPEIKVCPCLHCVLFCSRYTILTLLVLEDARLSFWSASETCLILWPQESSLG